MFPMSFDFIDFKLLIMFQVMSFQIMTFTELETRNLQIKNLMFRSQIINFPLRHHLMHYQQSLNLPPELLYVPQVKRRKKKILVFSLVLFSQGPKLSVKGILQDFQAFSLFFLLFQCGVKPSFKSNQDSWHTLALALQFTFWEFDKISPFH